MISNTHTRVFPMDDDEDDEGKLIPEHDAPHFLGHCVNEPPMMIPSYRDEKEGEVPYA